MKYLFKKIEPKWQAKWEEAKVFEAKDNSDKPKFYGLVEFPYPSGAGMHVGHIKAYSSLEVISRKRRMEGYNVLFPIGFDAFGLPTENYAVKTIEFRFVTVIFGFEDFGFFPFCLPLRLDLFKQVFHLYTSSNILLYLKIHFNSMAPVCQCNVSQYWLFLR